jgi:hypothetical protein
MLWPVKRVEMRVFIEMGQVGPGKAMTLTWQSVTESWLGRIVLGKDYQKEKLRERKIKDSRRPCLKAMRIMR